MKHFRLLAIGAIFLAPVSQGKARELNLIVIAGDETAMGAPLSHKGQVYTTQADKSLPFVYSVKSKDKRKWYSSAKPRSLGPLKAYNTNYYQGPELTLLRSLKLEDGKNWGVVKVAAEGSTLFNDWLSGASFDKKSGELVARRSRMMASYYMHLLRVTQRAITDFRAQGIEAKVQGFVWMQGYLDTWSAPKAKLYQASLDTMINLWREDFGFQVPFIVTRSSFGGSRKPASFEKVNQSKEKAVKQDYFSAIVSTEGLSFRSHHELSQQGHAGLGLRLAKKLTPMLEASMPYAAKNKENIAIAQPKAPTPRKWALAEPAETPPSPEVKARKIRLRESAPIVVDEEFQLSDFPEIDLN